LGFEPARHDRSDGPTTQHDPCNVDRVVPGRHLKPDRPARHDPFHYPDVPGSRVGRHETDRDQARSIRHDLLARYNCVDGSEGWKSVTLLRRF
jgi:hypothetical protein